MTNDQDAPFEGERDAPADDALEAREAVGERRCECWDMGVVLRGRPGATRWAAVVWRVIGLLPGAGPVDAGTGRELRRAEVEGGEEVDLHAATLTCALWRSDVEAYDVALSHEPPLMWVVCRPNGGAGAPTPFLVTASPFEAQDYSDSGEEVVEAVRAPDAAVAWIRDFADRWRKDTPFKKRRRDRVDVDGKQDGVGDVRVAQAADVYRAPGAIRAARRGEGA